MILSKQSPKGYELYYRKADGGLQIQIHSKTEGLICVAQNDGRDLKAEFNADKTSASERDELTGYLNVHLAAYLDGRI